MTFNPELTLAEISRLCFLADHHVRQALAARDKRTVAILLSRFGKLQKTAREAEIALKRGVRWRLECECGFEGRENEHLRRECERCGNLLRYRNLEKS